MTDVTMTRDTIRPRLDAAGADPERVFILNMVNKTDKVYRVRRTSRFFQRQRYVYC